VEAVFGRKGQVRVRGTIEGYPLRRSLMPAGRGRQCLVVGRDIREQIGATQGSTVRVALELDTEPRTVQTPEHLRSALDRRPEAAAAWVRLAHLHQKAYVDWISQAKSEATRLRRIEATVERVAQGLNLK